MPIQVLRDPFNNPTKLIPPVRFWMAPGVAAGAQIDVPGLDKGRDILLQVLAFDPATGAAVDLTDEFFIDSDNDISNDAGGTATTGDIVFIFWYDHSLGETTNAPWNPPPPET